MTNKTLHTELAIPQPIVQLSMLGKDVIGHHKINRKVYTKTVTFSKFLLLVLYNYHKLL